MISLWYHKPDTQYLGDFAHILNHHDWSNDALELFKRFLNRDHDAFKHGLLEALALQIRGPVLAEFAPYASPYSIGVPLAGLELDFFLGNTSRCAPSDAWCALVVEVAR
jgi:hypothetical protein